MSAHLDIWDVTEDHPKAREELIELQKGFERYEKLRKLSVRQFSKLFRDNLYEGKSFDELVDEL